MNNDIIISSEDLLEHYHKVFSMQQVIAGIPEGMEVTLANSLSKSITEEIAKNPDNPRAAWLEFGAALMLVHAHALNVMGALVVANEREQAAMMYGAQALKREGIMIGGWVLFICGAVAHFAGWL